METIPRTDPVEYCEVEKIFSHFALDAVNRFNSAPGTLRAELTIVKLGPLPHTIVEWVAGIEAPEDIPARHATVQAALRQPIDQVAAVVEVAPHDDALVVTVHTREAPYLGLCAIKARQAQFRPLSK